MPQPSLPPQPVHQEQTNSGYYNNSYSPATSNTSNSEAENTSIQQGTLQNTQINTAANLGYYKYAGGTQMPSKQQLITSVNYNWDGRATTTVSYIYNFGGQAQQLAEQEVKNYEVGAIASLCTGLIRQNINIDYSLAPEYGKCKAFQAVQPMTSTPVASNEIALLKAEMLELIKANKELQRLNQAAQLRIIQMQHQPKSTKTAG